jgi:DNA sulfur modification protein DndC
MEKQGQITIPGLVSDNKLEISTSEINRITKEIQDLYLRDQRPWIIGYSGGKDSTAVAQLIWNAIKALPTKSRKKEIYVISSDTKVDTPQLMELVHENINHMNSAAKEEELPIYATLVTPSINDTFWVNLIGRGYPAPTTRFRWCTERLKIRPTLKFIKDKVNQYGEIIMVLGLRKAESDTRNQTMTTYEIKGNILRKHSTLPGANVYAPIAEFTENQVWDYLEKYPNPWGVSNEKISELYRQANLQENVILDENEAPNRGGRLGCWVCTLVTKNNSLEHLSFSAGKWMEPLKQYWAFLCKTTIPENKKDFRSIRGRNGRVIFKKDGTLAARTYTLETLKHLLRELLRTEKEVRKLKGDATFRLLSHEELCEIQKLWRLEKQDWSESAFKIYEEEYPEHEIEFPQDDNSFFTTEEEALLNMICKEQDIPYELVAQLLDVERQLRGMERRSGIQKKIQQILNQEWRKENDILTEYQELQNLKTIKEVSSTIPIS